MKAMSMTKRRNLVVSTVPHKDLRALGIENRHKEKRLLDTILSYAHTHSICQNCKGFRVNAQRVTFELCTSEMV